MCSSICKRGRLPQQSCFYKSDGRAGLGHPKDLVGLFWATGAVDLQGLSSNNCSHTGENVSQVHINVFAFVTYILWLARQPDAYEKYLHVKLNRPNSGPSA